MVVHRSKYASVLVVAALGCAQADRSTPPRTESLTELAEGAAFVWTSVAEPGAEPTEGSQGDPDAIDLVEDGGWELGVAFGSADNATTEAVAYVRPLELWAFEGDSGRPSAHAEEEDEEEGARLARVVASGLADLVDEDVVDPEAVEEVLIGLPDIAIEPIDQTVERNMRANGLSWDEYPALRLAATQAQYAAIFAHQDQSLAILAELVEFDLVDQFALANAALIRVARRDLRALALSDHVRRMEPNGTVELLSINSETAIEAAQIEQFISRGETGGAANPGRHSFGHIAIGFIDYVFEDDFDSIGDSRVSERWICYNAPSCVTTADMDSSLAPPILTEDPRHGTACAQIAAGLAPLPASWRNTRSGSSRETTMVFAAAGAAQAGYLRSVDRMGLSLVDLVSSSWATPEAAEPGCSATPGLVASAVNRIGRENSVLWVQSAGNQGHVGSGCTLRAPAGAAYAFTVGGLLEQADITAPLSNRTTIQSGAIASYSSRGRIPYLSGSRSVVATTAVGGQTFLPNGMPNVYAAIGSGTSFAAPLVAGAAADMRDWWLGHTPPLFGYAGFIQTPGFMIAHMLLMGDRMSEGGTPLSTGFDSLYGNGRFRARVFDAAGMDDPWAMSESHLFVTAGTGVTLSMPTIPAGVDRLVVVAWWAEPNHVNGADITMSVRRCDGSYTRGDLSYDTRKRVVIRSVDTSLPGCWQIVLQPYSVPTNPWDGGLARRDVVYAWYYEDEARDDLSGAIQ